MNDATKEPPKQYLHSDALEVKKTPTGNRWAITKAALGKGGRNGLYAIGVTTTVYWFGCIVKEVGDYLQERSTTLSAETDRALQQQKELKGSTLRERKELALAEAKYKKVRARVIGDIAQRQALEAPLPPAVLGKGLEEEALPSLSSATLPTFPSKTAEE